MKSWIQIHRTHLTVLMTLGTEVGEIPWSCLANQVSRIAKLWLQWELLFQKIKCCFLVHIRIRWTFEGMQGQLILSEPPSFPGVSLMSIAISESLATLLCCLTPVTSWFLETSLSQCFTAWLHTRILWELWGRSILLDFVDLRFDLSSRISRLPSWFWWLVRFGNHCSGWLHPLL